MVIAAPKREITGIGSLPDIGIKEGLRLIHHTFPTCPHWPQFPKRKYEYFTYQFLYPLVRLEILKFGKDNSPYLDKESPYFVDSLTEFYEEFLMLKEGNLENVDFFAPPREAAEGFFAFVENLNEKGVGSASFLKGQVVGPLSVGLQLYDMEGRLAFYDEQLRDLLTKSLEGSITWQVQKLSKFGLPVIIFVDEGLLQAYGHREFLALNDKNIIAALRDLFNCIRDSGAVSGIHVCSQADWDLVFSSPPDIINFDAYYYFSPLLSSTAKIKTFLERGGTIAWGIVPASEKAFDEDVRSLAQKLENHVNTLEKHGINKELVYNNSMITPSCGTGLFDLQVAERVYALTAQLGRVLFTSDQSME